VSVASREINAIVERYRETVRPIHVQAQGLRKHYVLVDREVGRMAIIGVWESTEAITRVADTLEPAREELWRAFGGVPELEGYEIADEI
jgi:hypothetical protein